MSEIKGDLIKEVTLSCCHQIHSFISHIFFFECGELYCVAYRILVPDQRLNPCLRQQNCGAFGPLDHQGIPSFPVSLLCPFSVSGTILGAGAVNKTDKSALEELTLGVGGE